MLLKIFYQVNAKEALNNRLSKSVDNLKEKAENALEGRGIKRKTSFKNVIILKKQKKNITPKFNDIFT